jgi:hypothetical protein
MNTFRQIALATFATLGLAGLVHADAGRSRADVIAETEAARAAGTLGACDGEDSGSFRLSAGQPASVLAREQVRAEVLAARAAGELGALDGEDGGSFRQAEAQPPSLVSRAQVQAQVLAAREAGAHGALDGEDSGSFYLAQHGWSDPRGRDIRYAQQAH